MGRRVDRAGLSIAVCDYTLPIVSVGNDPSPSLLYHSERACHLSAALLSSVPAVQEDVVQLQGLVWPLPCEPEVSSVIIVYIV